MVEEKTIDILKHRLVPHHTILNEDETRKICEKYNVQKEQFPKIFSTDATVKELGSKLGDVIKIERKSPTAGETTYYRIVSKKTR